MAQRTNKSNAFRNMAVATSLTTLIIVPFAGMDPVNVPKFWILICMGFFGITYLIVCGSNIIGFLKLKINSILIFMYFLGFLTFIFSSTPKTQQLYGVYGRNTGFLTYLSLLFIMLFFQYTINTKNSQYILRSYGITSFILIIYGFLQLLNFDPVKWSEKYSRLFGTLGNPNFFSAFLGMSIGGFFTYILFAKIELKYVITLIILCTVATVEILKSGAIQGILVAGFCIAISLLFYFYKKEIKKYYVRSYVLGIIISSTMFILGIINIGPLSNLNQQLSVTTRTAYWNSGLQMVIHNLIIGQGFDSYGDWYRYYRNNFAIEEVGNSVVSDASHNVFLDIGVNFGGVGLICYLFFCGYVIRASYVYIKSNNFEKSKFMVFYILWLGFLVQSLVSINNIGLAVWGWVLPGCMLGIIRVDKEARETGISRFKFKERLNLIRKITVAAGFLVGFVLGAFQFNADSRYRNSLIKGDGSEMITSSLQWPMNSIRLVYTSGIFDQNNLKRESLMVALKAVEFNPRDFYAWKMIYNSNVASEYQKKQAMKKMKQLDPLNSDLLK